MLGKQTIFYAKYLFPPFICLSLPRRSLPAKKTVPTQGLICLIHALRHLISLLHALRHARVFSGYFFNPFSGCFFNARLTIRLGTGTLQALVGAVAALVSQHIYIYIYIYILMYKYVRVDMCMGFQILIMLLQMP